MSRMTCRNGLVFVAAIGLGLMVTSARGGNLNPTSGPTDPNSAMFTLEDIYNKLKSLNAWTNVVTKRPGAFTEPTGGPTNGTMHSLNDIMTLVTNRAPAPVPKTGQKTSYLTNDDGWYGTNFGVAWPNPRFSPVATNGAETNQIRDNLTGLIWAQNANLPGGPMDWTNAVKYCATNINLSFYGGTNDWRLPNRRELFSLIDDENINPSLPTDYLLVFVNVQGEYYWSSTTYTDNTSNAYRAYLYSGTVITGTKGTAWYVWPVRGGQ